jgi:hypothetical protein
MSRWFWSAAVVLMLSAFSSLPQGTFRNMDFELTQIPQNQPAGLVSTASALPFWTVYYGSTQQTSVYWNATSAGSTLATLLGLNGDNGLHPAIDGGYSVNLTGSSPDAAISQGGQLPTDAVSLLFKAQFGLPGQQLTVSIGGATLPMFDVSSGPNYTLYGINVSQFAGMQEELRFTVGGPLSSWTIDDIVFSTTPVPEPTGIGLLAVGGLLLRGCLSRGNR